MKILTFTLVLLASLPAFSTQYTCAAGRSDIINFSMDVEETQAILKFQKATNMEIISDLKGKTATLDLDADRTSEASGWTIYAGKLEVLKTLNEYRHFEVSINPKTPNRSSTIVGNFSIGPRKTFLGPAYLSQYSMSCQLTK